MEARWRATELGQTLRTQGRRQNWLASQVGISQSFMSLIIQGERTVGQGTAERMAFILGVPLRMLFELSVESETMPVERETVAA